jgi:predicted AlkP superfamily phosphohydrolase/phosphomutase
MHGVFSPFIKNPSSYGVRAMSGLDVRTRPIWDLLTEAGGRSLVVNVPTTYPPEPLIGAMITGMLTPGSASEFTFPTSLKQELLTEIPDYVIEPGRDADKLASAAEFRKANDGHERATHFMLRQGDWDFLMVVFSILDRAQHAFWADMDPAHPRHDPKTPPEFRNFIRETYEWLDGAIGRLIEKLPVDCRVLIVSDHGFCAELMEVRVNEALAAAGLLTFKSGRRVGAALKSLKGKVERRLTTGPEGNLLERKVHYGEAFLDEIDWKRTRAYFAQDKGVWVNLKGHEPQGIVAGDDFDRVAEEARKALGELMREDGGRVFQTVMRRDEAFKGRYADRLPDVVMIPSRDEYVYNERPSYGQVIVPADSTTGTHARNGIFIAWGTGIRSGSRPEQQLNLRDVGPTALYSLGCSLPVDTDGRLITEIFTDAVEPSFEGSAYRDWDPEAPTGAAYDEGEEAALRDRLRALGYIE